MKSKMANKRYYSLDILRIVSMIMIVILHYCTFGYQITKNDSIGNNASLLWFIYGLCYVAVNLYVLISGYFLCESKFQWKKVLKLAVEVWFYSIIIGAIFFFMGLEDFTNLKTSLEIFFPILTKSYWFVSIYLVMYIISPYMNKLINIFNKKEYKQFLLTTGIIYLVCNNLFIGTNLIDSNRGYNILWFIFLYFVAGYIRKFDLPKFKNIYYLLFYFLFSSITFLTRYFILNYLYVLDIFKGQENILYSYNSISVFGASLCLFMFFKNMRIKEIFPNLIYKISLATFGVFLIHAHPLIRRPQTFLKIVNIKNDINELVAEKILFMFLMVFIIFVVCVILDLIRQFIFKKIEN